MPACHCLPARRLDASWCSPRHGSGTRRAIRDAVHQGRGGRSAISRKVRTYYGSDLLLVAEVVSPRSGSERTDRVQKVREYAQAGIPAYWIVELDPEPKVTVLVLSGDTYLRRTE
ncbi:MAG TPA: Uma2 family endonuclease [Trebonia sp.]